jgi:CARDB
MERSTSNPALATAMLAGSVTLLSAALLAGALLLGTAVAAFADTPSAAVTSVPIDPGNMHELLPDLQARSLLPNNHSNARFAVSNDGFMAAGPFHITVVAGDRTFDINLDHLDAGKDVAYGLPGLKCDDRVVVVLDSQSQVSESNEGNNVLTFLASCPIDSGNEGHGINGG